MLEDIQSGAYNLLTNTRFWMILLVIIFFLIVAGYVYNKYVTPMVEKEFIPNEEFPSNNDDDDNNGEIEIIIKTLMKSHTNKLNINNSRRNTLHLNIVENLDDFDNYFTITV